LSPEEQTRINHLKELLYIYAQEHTSMGYRQGMHEIASYLLYALELELPQHIDNPLYASILANCFIMLERTLAQLELAYDASGEHSLQRMSQSILTKIHQNSPKLFQKLTTSPHIPPPPIYCTRWVRLLFSREVVGFENVFALWDIFFQFYPQIMRALEMASVARILLMGNALMNPNNNPLDLLMNVPQQQDIGILANLLKQLMAQTDYGAPISIPESQMLILPTTQSQGSAHGVSAPPVPARQTTTVATAPTLSQSYSDDSPAKNGSTPFSFAKMKDSLGKKSESIRKKIVTATNEWNRENSNGSTQFSLSSDILGAAGDVLRQASFRSNNNVACDTLPFYGEPLGSPRSMPMPEPPSPMKHQHSRWAQGLNDRILILQNYFMTIESSSSHDRDEHADERKVPSEVWEVMADLQRMQQELHNYSLRMP
jgi:Rab-GTPase-TBC domain